MVFIYALIVAAGGASMFTGNKPWEEIDYVVAGLLGVFLFWIVAEFLFGGTNALVLAGALIGCSLYHFFFRQRFF